MSITPELEKIICDSCIANSVKNHCFGKGEHKGKCRACSMYYRDPKSFFGYVKYYCRKLRYRTYGFLYRTWDKFKWWEFNHFGKRVPSCVSSGDIIEVLDIETKIVKKYKVNSVWINYDPNKPGFVVMSNLSSIESPKGRSISTMDTNLWLNLDSRRYHMVSINKSNKLRYNEYYHKWED